MRGVDFRFDRREIVKKNKQLGIGRVVPVQGEQQQLVENVQASANPRDMRAGPRSVAAGCIRTVDRRRGCCGRQRHLPKIRRPDVAAI